MGTTPLRTERQLRNAGEVATIVLIALIPVLRFGGVVLDDTEVGLTRAPAHLLDLLSRAWYENGLGYDQTRSQSLLFPVNVVFVGLRALHVPPDYIHQVWVSLILLLSGLGMRWFIRTWLGTTSSLPVLLGAFGYMLSSYVIVIVTDTSMFLISYAMLPWSMTIALRTVRGDMQALRAVPLLGLSFLLTSATDIPLLLINMAFTTIFAAGVAVAARSWEKGLRRIATVLAGTVFGTVLLSFSLVPIAYSATIDPAQAAGNLGAETTALYDVDTSTHEVGRLQGYWALYSGYADRAYRPYRSYYVDDVIGTRVGFGVVGLAMIGLFLRRHDGVAVVLAVVALVSARLVIGTHPTVLPPGSSALAGWAFDHVPLMSIFRNTFKFMGVTSFAVVALLAGAMEQWLRRWESRSVKAAGVFLVVLVLLSNAEPAWAGELWWPDRGSQWLPQEWFDAARWLNQQPYGDGEGVLYTPDMPFSVYTWGKPPTDPSEMLVDRPQAYLAAGTRSAIGDKYLKSVYNALNDLTGSDDSKFMALLQQARLRYVLVRRDVRSRYYFGVTSPFVIAEKLSNAAHFHLALDLPNLSIYRLDAQLPAKVTLQQPGTAGTLDAEPVTVTGSLTSSLVTFSPSKSARSLVLREGYHNGWSATTVGDKPRSLSHNVVDGFANGWLIPAGISQVHITYGPALSLLPARIVSAAGVVVAIALLVVSIVRIRPTSELELRR